MGYILVIYRGYIKIFDFTFLIKDAYFVKEVAEYY